MKLISSTAAFICVCAVVCSIISLIMPNARMKKPARLVLTLFFLCSLISPIRSFFNGISEITLNYNTALTDEYTSDFDLDEAVFNETVQNLTNIAYELLSDGGIIADRIEIQAHIDMNNRIKLDRISIYISEADTKTILKINSIITERFEKAPEIITGSRNE